MNQLSRIDTEHAIPATITTDGALVITGYSPAFLKALIPLAIYRAAYWSAAALTRDDTPVGRYVAHGYTADALNYTRIASSAQAILDGDEDEADELQYLLTCCRSNIEADVYRAIRVAPAVRWAL